MWHLTIIVRTDDGGTGRGTARVPAATREAAIAAAKRRFRGVIRVESAVRIG